LPVDVRTHMTRCTDVAGFEQPAVQRNCTVHPPPGLDFTNQHTRISTYTQRYTLTHTHTLFPRPFTG